MTFDEFRRWALDQSRSAARRWEEPEDDEVKVVLAVDDYEAFHVIPMPPGYNRLDRGHVHWLAGAFPDIVANRSLQRVALRTSAWASRNPKYRDQPVDDPQRSELLVLSVAEKGRYELWQAEITRSRSGLPALGDWKLNVTDADGLSGALPKHIRKALDQRGLSRGPTMPSAEMVLSPWDVPDDFFPVPAVCGPIDHARDSTVSTFVALFRPVAPGPVIISQAFAFENAGAPSEHMEGAIQALVTTGNREFEGHSLGEACHYFEGKLDGDRLYRYTALWRYPGVFCEVAIAGPPGRFKRSDLDHYAAVQDKRATAELNPRPVAR